MSAEALRDGRQDTEYYNDLLAELIVEVTAGVYQLVTTTGISDRVMDTLREGRPNLPYFEDLISKCMLYDAGTGKYYLNVSGGGGGGGNLQTTLNAGNSADNIEIVLTKDTVDNRIDIDPINLEIKSNYKTFDATNLTTIDIGGGSTDRVSGMLQLNCFTRSFGGVFQHRIHAGNSPSVPGTSVFTHNLQKANGFLLQNVNESGKGLSLIDADATIAGDGVSLITKDLIRQLQGTFNGNAIRIDHLDGSGAVDYNLLLLSADALQFYDTSGSGANVDIRPNGYNNQLITWPDITGGMKTVGTFNDTFVSGVLTLTDTRFDIGQPNFIVMITNTNGSSALGQAYKFELLTLPTRVKITSLKQNGTTETNDGSSVRISCLF